MSIKKLTIISVLSFTFLFGLAGQARADDITGDFCFCYDDVSVIKPENRAIADGVKSSELLYCERSLNLSGGWGIACNKESITKGDGTKYGNCDLFTNPPNQQVECRSKAAAWAASKKAQLEGIKEHEKTTTGLVGAILPECAVNPNQSCDDVGIFIIAGINLTTFLFGIVGALALLMFVYGGFVLILSQGNPEKVKQGTGIMTAAVIGLIIAFGGYFLVRFLGQTLGLKTDYLLNQ